MVPARRTGAALTCAVALTAALSGVGACRRSAPGSVDVGPMLYCSVDEAFAREILSAYTRDTGRPVRVIFDSEAGKTTGLVRRLESEGGRAGADVFWSSEIFNTILLARRGLLAPYDPPAARDIPARYRDPKHRWTAFGLRARVLAFDAERVQEADVPKRWEDLAKPEWSTRLALANPIFGTTRGHVSAMFALWGGDRGRAFLRGLAGKALVTDGNSTALRLVWGGARDVCMTDTDDVAVARRTRPSLRAVFPDMGDGGTLLIPNTVAIVSGGAHRDAARHLVDFLVSADVERRLARSGSRNIPVRAALRDELHMTMPPETSVSYGAIADAMDEAMDAVREILIR